MDDRNAKTFVSFDGTEIFYEVTFAPRALKNLILIHGLGGNLRAWDKERKMFQKLGYTTYALDLRGHGKSGKPGIVTAYTVENLALDVLEFIQHEKIKKPVLVGHCLGGMVALTVEGVAPGTADSLVLVDTDYKPAFFAQPFLKYPLARKIFSMVSKSAPGFRHTDVHFSKPSNNAEYDARRILADIIRMSPRDYLLMCENLMDFNCAAILGKIAAPTLVIVGSKDTVFPPAAAKQLANKIPNAKLVCIEGANHIIVLNNPVELVEEIQKFLG